MLVSYKGIIMRKLVLLCGVVALLSGLAQAQSGKINFTGEIIDTACEVDTNSQNLDVNLGRVSKTDFSGAGTVASETAFKLNLKNCPEVTTATIKFDATPKDGDYNVIDISADSGAAKGVGVQILDSARKVVPLYTASSLYDLAVGDNSLKFTARYYATGEVTSGPANAVANFTVNYN
jgi:major type 1 subunit fimbrin (pilin)